MLAICFVRRGFLPMTKKRDICPFLFGYQQKKCFFLQFENDIDTGIYEWE